MRTASRGESDTFSALVILTHAETLVAGQEWARRYATRPGVTVVSDLSDILDELVKVVEAPHQLTLSF